MQLSGLLTAGGNPPKSIRTSATVTIEAGVGITGIALETEAEVPGITKPTSPRRPTRPRRSARSRRRWPR